MSAIWGTQRGQHMLLLNRLKGCSQSKQELQPQLGPRPFSGLEACCEQDATAHAKFTYHSNVQYKTDKK
jgi:hypothetical protein